MSPDPARPIITDPFYADPLSFTPPGQAAWRCRRCFFAKTCPDARRLMPVPCALLTGRPFREPGAPPWPRPPAIPAEPRPRPFVMPPPTSQAPKPPRPGK